MSTKLAAGKPMAFPGSRSPAATLELPPAEQQSLRVLLIAAVTALIAMYWNMFTLTKDFWSDDTYSHGWIIPFIGLFLMWSQRDSISGGITREQENRNLMQVGIPLAVALGCYLLGQYGGLTWCYSIGWVAYAVAVLVALWIVLQDHRFAPFESYEPWIGVAIIIPCFLVRIYAALVDTMPFDRLSFIGALFGVFILVAGLPMVRRMWAALLFFAFLFPLPSVLENNALTFLQKIAAMASTTVLQVLGVIAHRQGNTIHIDQLTDKLEIAQACSGLRMLTIFCAMSIALVLLIERPWWDKFILLISAIPIALLTNIIRIVVTALLYLAVEGTSWAEPLHQSIHDYAGYAMIFIAASIMWVEYKILTWLFVEEGDEGLRAMSLVGRGPAAQR